MPAARHVEEADAGALELHGVELGTPRSRSPWQELCCRAAGRRPENSPSASLMPRTVSTAKRMRFRRAAPRVAKWSLNTREANRLCPLPHAEDVDGHEPGLAALTEAATTASWIISPICSAGISARLGRSVAFAMQAAHVEQAPMPICA